MTALKVFAWLYAVTGSLYFLKYFSGNEVVTRLAVGPLYALMVVSPVILGLLVVLPIAWRLSAE